MSVICMSSLCSRCLWDVPTADKRGVEIGGLLNIKSVIINN